MKRLEPGLTVSVEQSDDDHPRSSQSSSTPRELFGSNEFSVNTTATTSTSSYHSGDRSRDITREEKRRLSSTEFSNNCNSSDYNKGSFRSSNIFQTRSRTTAASLSSQSSLPSSTTTAAIASGTTAVATTATATLIPGSNIIQQQPRRSSTSRSNIDIVNELNRIKFDSIGLYGRDTELETLHDAFERLGKQEGESKVEAPDVPSRSSHKTADVAVSSDIVHGTTATSSENNNNNSSSNNNKTNSNVQGTDKDDEADTRERRSKRNRRRMMMTNLVLISGESGTGKSAVIKEFCVQRKKRDGKDKVLFVSGKFDQHYQGQGQATKIPHAAFRSALSQLCVDIQSHALYDTMIRDSILDAVGDNYFALLNLIPNLGELVYSAKAGRRARRRSENNGGSESAPTSSPLPRHHDESNNVETSISSIGGGEQVNENMEETDTGCHEEDGGYDIVKSQKKFKYILQQFFAAVCRPQHRVILFLDDVQWIDSASLDLLEMILMDPVLEESLLIICSYRKNDDQMNPFTERINQIIQGKQQKQQNQQQQFGQSQPQQQGDLQLILPLTPAYTSITIGNLSFETVHAYITDLFNAAGGDETEGLAQIVFKKVQGNMFFLKQYLSALRDDGYIRYNIGTTKWIWADEEIIRRSSKIVGDNVLTILMDKVQKLPTDMKQILQIAACLGVGSFDGNVITTIARNVVGCTSLLLDLNSDNDDEKVDISKTQQLPDRITTQILQSLVDEGLLECYARDENYQSSNMSYCFVHDQIELAAYGLLKEDTIPQLKMRVGRILYEHKADFDYQSMLFTIVDLWNIGYEHIKDSNDIQTLIHLNYSAGLKALDLSAFEASALYIRKSIHFIPENERWNAGYYDLSLSLYNVLIKAEYSNGTWGQLESDINTVLSQKKGEILDKTTAYNTMITISSIQEHNHEKAIELAVDVLGQLGAKFRPQLGMLAVVGAIVKTKILLGKIPLESLLDQNEMDDPYKIEALEVIATMQSSLYAANPALLTSTVLKTLRWSLKYGISKHTAKCIGVYALLEMALGKTESAIKASKLSLQLSERQNLMTSEYAPISSAYGFVLPWKTSLHVCRNHLLSGYNIGLARGDLEYGFMNIVLYCFFCYSAGKPLSDLEADMRDYASHMEEYNQELQLQFLKLTWQTILNLMGRCDNLTVLTGEAMDADEMLKAADKDNNPPLRAQLQCHRLQLAVYYRDFELAGKLIRLASNIGTVNPANPIIWRTALFEGIAAFELVRLGQSKWKKTALNSISKIQKWVDAGNVNCIHILFLLQAEEAAIVNGDTGLARSLYEKAIVTSARHGYRNDKALACERCGDMYELLGEKFWTEEFCRKAYETYEEMEAHGKLEHMVKHRRYLRPSLDIEVVVGQNAKGSHNNSMKQKDHGSFAATDDGSSTHTPPVYTGSMKN